MKNVLRGLFFSFFSSIFHAFNQVKNIPMALKPVCTFLMLSWNRNIGLQNLLVYFRDKSIINYFHFNWEWYGRFFAMHGGAENLKKTPKLKKPVKWDESISRIFFLYIFWKGRVFLWENIQTK